MAKDALTKNKKRQITSVFLTRFSAFLVFTVIALFFIYILGNVQNFLDETQLLILKFSADTSVLLVLVSLSSFIVSLTLFIQTRHTVYLLKLIGSVAAGIFGTCTAILCTAVTIIANGG